MLNLTLANKKVWLGKVFSPGHRQLMCCALKSTSEGKGERRRAYRCKKELSNEQRDHAVCVWLLLKWIVFGEWSGVYSDCRFCWKTFLKWMQTELNGDKYTWICPIETLIFNCWTNDYTLDQLDKGKIVQGGIECVNVCHLDYCSPTVEVGSLHALRLEWQHHVVGVLCGRRDWCSSQNRWHHEGGKLYGLMNVYFFFSILCLSLISYPWTGWK
jgi:hypothetical protein